jgi:hypothetical protein
MVNLLLQEHALTDRFQARFGLCASQPITVRFIRMSEELLLGLDSPSKLSRQPSHIARLIEDGKEQAQQFLSELGAPEPPSDRAGMTTGAEIH